MNRTSEKSPYYNSPAKTSRYNKNRNNKDWVDAIHFNNNGKKLCSVIVTMPHHTTDKALVTCRYCKSKLGRV